MVGSDFLAYVKKILIRADKDDEVYEAMTDVAMDMRLRMMSDDHKEEAYATIGTIGDYRLCIPTDFSHLIGTITLLDTSSDQNYSPLTKISKQKYDLLYGDRVASSTGNRNTGTPVNFCYYGKEIFVGPAVDKTTYRFQLNYTTEGLTDNDVTATSEIPFTDRYRSIVRAGVMKEMYIVLENYTEAEAFSNLYESGLIKIINNDKENIRDDGSLMYSGV